jgi:hypothetical protein
MKGEEFFNQMNNSQLPKKECAPWRYLVDTNFGHALMMEAARTSETLVNFYQTTRCYNPEDSHLHLLFI